MMIYRRRTGFSLIEVLLGMALAAVLVIGVLSFFGDTLQRFVQHEDTISGVRDIQLILLTLRRDLELIDGHPTASSSASTGTTFPKKYLHMTHSIDSDRLLTNAFIRQDNDTPLNGSPHLANNLPPGAATDDLMRRNTFLENACAWIVPLPGTPERDRLYWLHLNVRRRGQREQVLYRFSPHRRELVRFAGGRRTSYGEGSIEKFSALPVLEFVTFPDDTDQTARLLRLFVQVSLVIRAADDGGRVEKRTIPFTTNVTPKLVHFAQDSRWMR